MITEKVETCIRLRKINWLKELRNTKLEKQSVRRKDEQEERSKFFARMISARKIGDKL